MLSNPIFIIGTERSGSNMLRLLLDSHSQIAIPHPTHMMRDLAPAESLYGDLEQEKNLVRLVDDVVKVANTHFSPWPIDIHREAILSQIQSRSLYGIYAALQDLYLEHRQKSRWGCKSTFMWQQIDTIVAHHEAPRFIHLVRDPRDVAVSARKSIFSKCHPFKQAELWNHEQSQIELKKKVVGGHFFLTVRYEDLTADPMGEMKRIMSFLGEEFEEQQLDYFNRTEATRLAQLSESWKNCSQPVNQKSVGKFQKELSRQEIGWVEFLAADLMRIYQYEFVAEERQQAPSFVEKIQIEGAERAKRFEIEAKALFNDKNFFLRWKKWVYIQKMRRMRSY